MEQSASSVDSSLVGREVGTVNIQNSFQTTLFEYLLERAIVFAIYEFLNLTYFGFGKEGSGELELLENLRVARDVNRQAALVIGDRVIYRLLLKQKSHNGGPALPSSNVKRGVAILVPGIDINHAGEIRQDIFDHGIFGALYGQM